MIYKTLARLFGDKKYYTSYYKSAIHKYTDIDSYLNVFRKVMGAKSVVKTKRKITFLDDLPFGSSFNEIKNRIYGSYRIVRELENISIILSEVKIHNYKFIVELHFYKQKLVFYKYIFKSKEHKNLLLNLMLDKYLNKDEADLRMKNLTITDNDNNRLLLEDEVHLSISYLTFKFGFLEHLFELKEQKELDEFNRSEKALKELLSKL